MKVTAFCELLGTEVDKSNISHRTESMAWAHRFNKSRRNKDICFSNRVLCVPEIEMEADSVVPFSSQLNKH